MEDKINRRNLSGIYIFYKFEEEDKPSPTCFEDCSSEKQDEFMNSLDLEGLKNLCKILANDLRKIGDKFDIMSD